jgi:hypothetical protein
LDSLNALLRDQFENAMSNVPLKWQKSTSSQNSTLEEIFARRPKRSWIEWQSKVIYFIIKELLISRRVENSELTRLKRTRKYLSEKIILLS